MIEQQIEDRVLDKVANVLSADGLNVQYTGQLKGVDGIKALENA